MERVCVQQHFYGQQLQLGILWRSARETKGSHANFFQQVLVISACAVFPFLSSFMNTLSVSHPHPTWNCCFPGRGSLLFADCFSKPMSLLQNYLRDMKKRQGTTSVVPHRAKYDPGFSRC
jgi:hypothetical protein